MKGQLLTGVICTLLVVACAAAGAEAAPTTENFQVILDGQNHVMDGSGSGWDGGAWIYYPNTGWWNQWFYDDPPDPLRWKYIDYNILADQVQWDPTDTIIDIVINWSTLSYPANPLSPPIPPLDPAEEALFIERSYVVYSGSTDGYNGWSGRVVIPDYNPEWVSLDIRTRGGPLNVETVVVFGSITHECLPEPATLSVLALGGLGVLLRRKRK